MKVLWKSLAIMLALVCLLCIAPMISHADENHPLLIEPEVLMTAPIPDPEPHYTLAVQATSWNGDPYRYILTLSNFSPWPMDSLYVLDRYFSDDPDEPEIAHEWVPEALEPGQAASFAITFDGGPLPASCHQIEISLSDGLGFILMDCSEPSATIIWDIPLGEDVESYLVEPPAEPSLTLAEPVGPSKLGIHVTRNSSPQIMDFVREAHPAVVAAVGDVGWLADVKEVSPETVTIGRFAEGDQGFEGDPRERAREFVNANAALYLANLGVDYWLGWNEPIIDEIWQIEWYAAFEVERTIAMSELGLKVAVGNFSVGTPEAAELYGFLPALATAKEFGGVFALHEYSAPTLYDGVGAEIPGIEGIDGGGALTLRYRYWYEHFLKPYNLVLPMVVTEAGVDGGVLRSPDLQLLGWRDFIKDLPEPLFSQTEDTYLEQLSWYDDQLRRDPYVIGFAVFNAGDDNDEWASFDITDMLPRFTELTRSKE